MLSDHTKSSVIALGLLPIAAFASSCSGTGSDYAGLFGSGAAIGGTGGAGGSELSAAGDGSRGTGGANTEIGGASGNATGAAGARAEDATGGIGGNGGASAAGATTGVGTGPSNSGGLGAATGGAPQEMGGLGAGAESSGAGELGEVGGFMATGSAAAMGGAGTSAGGSAQGGIAGSAQAGSAGAGAAHGTTSCGGCAVLTAPLSKPGDKAPAQILFASTNLTGKSVTLRACVVIGNANSALQIFVQNGAPNYSGDYDIAGYSAFSDLANCTAGMQNITLPIASVNSFDARSVSELVVQIITTQATTGPWVTSIVQIDSIAISDGPPGPWNFSSSASPLGLQNTAVPGSALSFIP